MATIFNNRLNHSAVVLATATSTITIAGNNSVSNIAIGDEVLTGASIRKIQFSGSWTVARGANTYFNLSGTDHWDLNDKGLSFNVDNSATLVLTLTGTGTIMVELGKIGTGNTAAIYYSG